ncbi:hypothetical protein MCOR27_003290 [Pyricularia oryzae]|nr:hypothetical protein MCOR01_009225 [Pyricularia oryzae]KAI6268668.1 hypothetical protein MCOR26_009086 [Pyricularia oryzae]KAI6283411.1 hypothetical protein MCOR27_003290 [Pyricularia oryzae]KAI6348374.1 hypothetical protein MCOR28_001586 [Pyricularia oryzae]KAI6385515.1 hypothetical protein MCOR32_001476 [Pyricularia oryzae]
MKQPISIATAAVVLATSGKHVSALATSRALSTLPELPTVDTVWELELRPGKKVALTGTAQQVVAKALELNPDYQMKKVPTSPSQPHGSSGSSNSTRLSKRDYTLCGGDPALQHRTWENIQYLFGLGQTLRIESHTCGRLACQYNSGIEWCNYALEAREHTTDWIAHAAEVVFADCFDGFVGGEFVSGRRVHDDLVVVVIRDSFDC